MEKNLETIKEGKGRAPLALLRMQKNHQGDENGKMSNHAEFCHRKAAEIKDAVKQRANKSSETQSRVERLRNTVTTLEAQVEALRSQLKDGDSALKRQHAHLAASKEVESEKVGMASNTIKSVM